MSADELIELLVALRELLASEWRVFGVGWPVFGWGLAALGLVLAVAGLVHVGRRLREALARRRLTAVGLSLLPPSVRQALTSSVLSPTMIPVVTTPSGDVVMPEGQPYLFVVRQTEAQVFSTLRDLTWTRPDLVRVIWDRRWVGERRRNPPSVSVERRRGERRRAWPVSWGQLGFLLVTPREVVARPVGVREGRLEPAASAPVPPREVVPRPVGVREGRLEPAAGELGTPREVMPRPAGVREGQMQPAASAPVPPREVTPRLTGMREGRLEPVASELGTPAQVMPRPVGVREDRLEPAASDPRVPERPPVAKKERSVWTRPRLTIWGLLLVVLVAVVAGLVQRRGGEGEPSRRSPVAPGQAVRADPEPAARAAAPATSIADESGTRSPPSERLPTPAPSREGGLQPLPSPDAPALRGQASPGPRAPSATARPPQTAPGGSAGVPASPEPVEVPRPAPTVLGQAAPPPGGSRPTQEARRRVRPAQCTSPPAPVAVRDDGTALGLWIDVELDTSTEPARCLYIVRRPDGSLRAVDSRRVQVSRP